MVILEVSGLEGLILGILGIWLIPPFILLVIGIIGLKKNKDASKWLFILALIYFLVGLGICSGMFV